MDRELMFLIFGFASLVILYSFSPEWGEAVAALSLVILLINRSNVFKRLFS